jgi:two-component system NtrC family sensor kinase
MSEGAVPRLLLVEDSDTQAIHFRHAIVPHGFAVERTSTAEEALERLNGELPDLLVVDYRLPGMNGDELVRIVRQSGRARTLPILMLTGDGGSAVERQGLDSGANAYVPKGGDPELLVSRMRALLRQRLPPRQTSDGGELRSARLLLVDESATYRTLLRGLLEAEGYGVLAAGTLEEALPALDDGTIDCVLLGIDGGARLIDAVRTAEVRRTAAGAGFELVALLGGDDPAAARNVLGAGADDVIAKDGDRDMLLVRLRATVRRKLARDEEARALAREREQRLELDHARAQAEAAEALAAANARLQETQAQLVQSAKMASLGELVAGIAHEINNPLAFILAHHGTVERAVRQAGAATDPDQRALHLRKAEERLASIRTGLVRIQDLVVKLRRFSRLDDETTRLDVPEAIDAVLTLLGPKIGPGVTIERVYAAPPVLTCSPALINQVVMNLVSNAADAIPADGGMIRIATESDDRTYRITVSDNGPGIPPALQERVFEPFFTTKEVGAGTGLGLAIAYGIVKAHGGTIEVGTAAEGGALFSITISVRS